MSLNSFNFDDRPLEENFASSDFERWLRAVLNEVDLALPGALARYTLPSHHDYETIIQNWRNSLPTQELARMIDHTLLSATTTSLDVKRACEEAIQFRFLTVCLNSRFIPLASEALSGSATLPIAVVGFPLGSMATDAKAFETELAIQNGAKEVDTVIALGALKAKAYREVFDDVSAVVNAAGEFPVKVIIECSALTHSEKIIACAIAAAAGARFIKTSTGFGSSGARAEDVALIRRVVGSALGVKASGGIKTLSDAEKMLFAGANRIGTSAGIAIVSRDETGSETDSGYI